MKREPAPLLVVVSSSAPRACARVPAALAQHSGIAAESIDLKQMQADTFLSSGPHRGVMDADTLLDWSTEGGDLLSPEPESGAFGSLLVYGFRPCAEHEALLRVLSAGRLIGVEATPATASFSVRSTPVVRNTCRAIVGLTLPTASCAHFAEAAESVWGPDEVLMTVAGRPFLVLLQIQEARVFLLSCQELPDPNTPVGPGHALLDEFPPLSAVLFYLRYAFGNRCWHSEQAGACLVIDDPLLRPAHGFLRFDNLAQEMAQSHTASTVSFIPWNFRRSDPAVVELFRKSPSRMSICVHGCDHTAHEFGVSDEGLLHARAQLGIARMKEHTRLTGLDFDPVMVFPQGIFAASALPALRAAGYLAAVNTTPHPVDQPGAPLRLGELLEPAVTTYGGVPLYTRFYPRDLTECAVNLFLGKPTLLASHHEYFRGGLEHFRALAKGLQELAPDLQWRPLGELLMRSCHQRVESGGALRVRFYTDCFLFRSAATHQQRVIFERADKDVDAISKVLTDGCPIEFERFANGIRFALAVPPAAELRLQVIHQDPRVSAGAVVLEPRGFSTFARRHLSELYDNYVAKSQLLVRLGHTVKRALLRL